MAGSDGERRAEWIGAVGERGSCWIWWRRPEEWAEVLAAWVSFGIGLPPLFWFRNYEVSGESANPGVVNSRLMRRGRRIQF